MKRAAIAALAALGVGLLAACSSGESSTTTLPASTAPVSPSTGPASTTTVVVTLPIPGVSTLPVATLPVTPPTAAPATSAPPAVTTTAAGPSCDGGTLFAVLQATTELPAGTGAESPLCAERWATMVIGAPNRERALAVFTFEGAPVWRLANLGTDQACSGAAVPPPLYDALGCAQWETE